MKNKKFWVSLMAGILAGILVLSTILGLLPSRAHAALSSDEIKEQIEQMQKENEQMQEQINSLKGELAALRKEQAENLASIQGIVSQKALIDHQIGLLHAQVINMNEQIAAYNVLIADKQEDVDEARQRLETLNAQYKDRIRAMEEDGNISYWSVLFEANSFSDLLDRLSMVQEIAAADNRRLKELRAAAQEVEEAQASLVAEQEALKLARKELDITQSQLQEKSDEAQVLLSDLTTKMEELKQQEGQYSDLMDEYEAGLEELEIAIGKAEIDLDEALYREYLATMTTAPTGPNLTPGPNAGAGVIGTPHVDESGITWLTPCDYYCVSSPFGMRWHPVHGGYRMHNGVDFAAACLMKSDGTTDSPIVAVREGVVITSQWSDSAGWYVTIDHLDGYRSTYMHMCCKPAVKVGDVVLAGQYLGCIGTTGTSTGNHLHFGIYKNGDPVNPMDYVG